MSDTINPNPAPVPDPAPAPAVVLSQGAPAADPLTGKPVNWLFKPGSPERAATQPVGFEDAVNGNKT
jgi:hypothetical protein